MNERARETLLAMARQSVEAVVKGQPAPRFDVTDPELTGLQGCFVTLKTDGRLRGCLGRFESDVPLCELVATMSAASVRDDPRFAGDRLGPEELDRLRLDISVLSPMKKTADPLAELELGVHGIYVVYGYQSGCFLPQVATETGWTKEEFLGHCCASKAGLPWDAWKDPDAKVYLFTAEVIEG